MSRVAIHVESNFSELRQCRLGPSNYADILIMNIFDMARNGLAAGSDCEAGFSRKIKGLGRFPGQNCRISCERS
jgi:hypothetical protein